MVKNDRRGSLLLVTCLLLGVMVGILAWPQVTSPSWQNALEAVADRDWQDAVDQLKQVQQQYPDFAPASYFLGRAYMGLGRYTEAVDAFDKALGIAPLAADINFYKGQALVEKGDILSAISSLNDELAVRRGARWPEVLIELAEANMMTGRLENARALLEQVISMEPRMPRGHYDLGLIYLATGKASRALEALGEALSLMNEYDRSNRVREEQRNPMGVTAVRRNQVVAEAELLRIIRDEDFVQKYSWAISFEQEGYWPYLYEAVARAQMATGEYSEARTTLRKLLRGDLRDHAPYTVFVYPNHSPLVHNMIGVAFLEDEKARLAKGMRVEYIVLEGPKDPYTIDPLTNERVKRPPSSAKEEFDLAIKQSPTYAEPYVNLGRMYEFYVDSWSDPQKAPPYDYDDAIQQYEQALKYKPDYQPALAQLGSCYFKQGKYNQAMAYLQDALKLDATDPIVHKYLGMTKLSQAPDQAADVNSVVAQMKDAIASLEQSLALDANQADVYNALGRAYERLGAVTGDEALFYQAMASYQDAINLNPRLVEAYINLGRARLAREWTRAGAPLQQALNILPESDAPSVKRQRAELHYLLGEVAVRQGRKADAETEFKKALALKADLVPAQLALASVYVASNQPLAAEEAYRQALDIASDVLELANVHFLYGKFLESPDRRRPFDAIAEYSAALSLDPSNEQAKQALDQLIASTGS